MWYIESRWLNGESFGAIISLKTQPYNMLYANKQIACKIYALAEMFDSILWYLILFLEY